MMMMSLMDQLNNRFNYNQEMYWLFIILTFIFGITANIFLNNNSKGEAFIFLILGTLCLGIAASYYIYNRNDDILYGYKVRDKILSWFGR